VGLGQLRGRPSVGHTSGLTQQVDSIVADWRLEVCDGSYIAAVMIATVSERSRAVGAESHPSKNEGWGTRPPYTPGRDLGMDLAIEM